ncbi:MAG: heavy metal translocating P-type ATPase metal-binding domain-containing protein [Methylococcaceae bacterium]|jgi:hypothetical protein
MSEEKKACDLCGLTVEVSGFCLKLKTGEKKDFCCEGCKGIYQMLNEDQILVE